jgi:NADH-quinone oxidoreductase subunit H
MSDFSFWITILTIICVMAVMLVTCAYLIFVERKVAAWVQNRIGPNRVGPWGLLQSIADGLKFLLKEDIIPDHVDKLFFLLAPAIAVTTALLAFAVVPFGATNPSNAKSGAYQFVIAPGVDIGIVFVFAVTSLTVYAIILGGWSSNSKYSLLGALRSSAQLVSYEIPMATSILGIVLLTGSLNLERIIDHQANPTWLLSEPAAGWWAWLGIFGWNVWYQPLAFLLFLTSVLAECNRLPFDLPEAEQELVGGYHTEYSALKFGMFFLGEYTHVVTTSFLLVVLFFGGWQFPWVAESGETGIVAIILKLVVFLLKIAIFILFYMLVRWTIPRFRFDQLMGLAWKVMIPLSVLNLAAVMVVEEYRLTEWVLLPISLAILLGAALTAGYWPNAPVRVAAIDREEELELVAR